MTITCFGFKTTICFGFKSRYPELHTDIDYYIYRYLVGYSIISLDIIDPRLVPKYSLNS